MSEQERDDDCVLVVPVKPWHMSASAQSLDADRWHQASIAEVMTSMHRWSDVSAKPLQMQCDTQTKRVRVVATEDIGREALSLFPCCPTAKNYPK
eukprot:2504705-Pyramimonas_sp.AAC.1